MPRSVKSQKRREPSSIAGFDNRLSVALDVPTRILVGVNKIIAGNSPTTVLLIASDNSIILLYLDTITYIPHLYYFCLGQH